ncbi:O-antigen polymerase [Acidisarcina polymorpha]|uniref:O-antigen polymerase n=1 Tax=Acidisarcina polymorpha TaxID=2211140 RepID=A0A2Z5FY19_9BACT|nr:O-antigen ligase family protein [Acidisarcina polymorpha]AXC11266.1 O-antigen polymerase [Acidisarcina polymorpha]
MTTSVPTAQSANVFLDETHAASAAAVPLATWIGFYFSFRLFFVLLAVRVFGQDAQVGVAASLAINYLFLLVAATYAFGPAPRTLRSLMNLPCLKWVIVYLGFTGISLFWSITSSLPAAAAFWCAMVADTAVVLLLLRSDPVDAVVNSLMRGYVWASCLIAAIAWMLPAQSDLRLGDEELLGPNQIGWVCAFAFFFAQYLMRNKAGNWTAQAFLLAITLLRSLSKTTIIAFLAAQLYILLRDRSMSRRTKAMFTLAAVLVVVAFSSLLTNYYDVYTNAGTESETLTGRLGIWAYFLSEAIDKPWLGHGFHSVWLVIPPFYDGFQARHAHNELLQQFYAYGAAGIFMLVAAYGSVLRQSRRLTDASLRTFLIGMLIFAVVRGLADTEAFDLSLPTWFIAIIGALIEQSRQRDQQSFSRGTA